MATYKENFREKVKNVKTIWRQALCCIRQSCWVLSHLIVQTKQTSERLATVLTDDARGRVQPTVGNSITRQLSLRCVKN